MIDSFDFRLAKIEKAIDSLSQRDRSSDDNQQNQIVLAKFANVVVQIISVIVMMVSSFADVIINLDSRAKLVLIVLFLMHLLFESFKPIYSAFFK